ncbi:MAG TPA: hypothetical protein PK530_23200, partial [Anaerolineales bacterium]|nr:hypothetical protein [Anaerolineales bacterium]
MQKLRLLLIALVWVVFGSLGGSLGLAQEIPPERTPEDVIELLEGSPEARHLPGAQPEPNLPAIADQPEDFEVAWSRMAFETYRAGNWELYRINPDNTDELRLTYSPAIDVYPALIHGGNELLFSSDESGSQEIYRMNADGTNVVRLTYTGATNLAPVLSPDGSKIVFRSSLSGNADIFVMNADGTGLTQLTFSSAFDGMPDWSSDGSRIIFSSNRTGTYSLWIMDADGSNQALLYTGFYAVYPQWSPVNDVIAFTGDSDGDDFLEVWTVNADGSKLVKRIPNGSLTDMWFPVWSPDGKYLAFTITNWTVYQDEYYWTYSYLNLRDLQTGNMQSIAHYDNRIWRASWVSTDVQPPTPCTVTAPAHSNWTSFIVDLNAQDEQTGPGGYDAEARWNDQTSWTPLVNHTDIYTLTSNTTVNTIFHGPPSGQVEFRCRAYDKVGNLAPWPVTASAVTFVDTLHPTSSASTETPVVHGTSATIT